MSSPPVPPVPPVLPLIFFGTEWANLITAQDHTATAGPYYCEVHLKIELESEDVYNRLNQILMGPATSAAELQSKEALVKALLKAELRRAGRVNESTLAIVEAIRLR